MRDYTPATDGPTLHDVVADNLDPLPGGETVYYHGFHIYKLRGGEYGVQYDGHIGTVCQFEAADYGDVTELVKALNRNCVMEAHMYESNDDTESLIEWAGRITTTSRTKADEQPDKYVFVPHEDR